MNLQDLKQLINSNGEKVIIVEDGKPVFVLLSFQDYQKRFNPREEKETEQEKTLSLIPQRAEKIKRS